MKAKILTNSNSLLTMFRLGAIEGELVNSKNFDEVFNNSVSDDNLAILIITKSVYKDNKMQIKNFRKDRSMPLIVIIDG
ncbi:V-type ATP synthase subunit F [uncultured Anaerococcus sp.]|uniref:V-type ATP synthase subunit F n=1 Tax=uncultured Anaerococcus sp. TaxID=293428 RepID=UPI0025D9971F|nr:V-type ATP synthase subunit F [uncultured Anaerococcus sp.]